MKIQLFIIRNIIPILIFFTVSCKENKTKKVASTLDKALINENNFEPISFKINFPDTVLVNNKYSGLVEYRSVLDSITEIFGNLEKDRYVRFIMSISKTDDFDFNYLKQKVVKDTFGASNNRNIPFYDIEFTNQGEYFIVGLINDLVLIDIHQRDENGEDLFRLIENEVRVSHRVYVIDNKVR